MPNSTTNIDQSTLLYIYESGIMDGHLTFNYFTCLLETRSLDPKYEHLSKNIFVKLSYQLITIIHFEN